MTRSKDEKHNRHRQQNEEKKKFIPEEFNASYWSGPNEYKLPADLERQILDHIKAFENALKCAKQMTLHQVLGSPAFRKLEELTDAEIAEEVNRLLEMMEQHQICLDTICEVSDRELYRFITEELFEQESGNMNLPGMITHYIYEEFHPNHEYEIRHNADDFFLIYLDKTSEYYTSFLSENATTSNWHNHFRDAFDSFDLNKFEMFDVEYDLGEKSAKLEFYCDFTAFIEGSDKKLQFNGKGTIKMAYQEDFWGVDEVILPKSLSV